MYLIARLLQRELEKCLRLVTFLPMQDMDKHFGKYIKAGPAVRFLFMLKVDKRNLNFYQKIGW